MYCITTNTLCTTENNARYSALTDWLIYHVVWFRVLNFCLFCWLVNFLLLQLCTYSTFHQWTRKSDPARRFSGIVLSIPYRVHCIETLI